MKLFNNVDSWSGKVNFVDENNVVLGYDTAQFCCEHAGWFIDDKPSTGPILQSDEIFDFEGWSFDPTYFQQVNGDEFDAGGMAIFRIVKENREKFIHIFNCQNGYYSHGFDFKVGEKEIQTGSL